MGATGRGHGFESLAERRTLTVLDFCGQVREMLSQPFRLGSATEAAVSTYRTSW